METKLVAFSSLLLILNVVSGDFTAPDGPQITWRGDAGGQAGDSGKQFFIVQENNPAIDNVVPMRGDQVDPDDVNEMQIPPPPTQRRTAVYTTFEDNELRNAINSFPDTIAYPSPAGNIETNQIDKDNSAFLKTDLKIGSSPDDDESSKKQPSSGNESYNYPELDKAAEEAVNSLPSSQESPLTPLIKAFSERVKEEANDNSKTPEEQAKEQFLHKMIILKLSKQAQQQKSQSEKLFGIRGIPEPSVQERQEGESYKSPNVLYEDAGPCDCDGGCFEVIPPNTLETRTQTETPKDPFEPEPVVCDDMAHQEESSDKITSQDQSEQSKSRADELNNFKYESTQTYEIQPKLLAHIVVMIRKHKQEDANTVPAIPMMPSPLSDNKPTPFKPQQNPSLVEVFSRRVKVYRSVNRIPRPAINDNEVDPPYTQMVGNVADGGHVENGSDENSGETHAFTIFPTIENGASNQNIHSQLKTQVPAMMTFHQSLPRELVLMRLLSNIVKQKAIANALREKQKSSHSPTSLPSKPSSSPPLSLVVIRHRNELPSTQLPPLHFPEESSGYKIKRIDDFYAPSTSEESNRADSSSTNEPRPVPLPLNGVNVSQADSNPQEVPWFIRSIIANINGQRSGLQTIPASVVLHPMNDVEQAPVFMKSVLAP